MQLPTPPERKPDRAAGASGEPGGLPPEKAGPGSPFSDPLIRYVTLNTLFGMGFGAAFAALVLWFDVSGIGRLILSSSSPMPALFLLFGSFMLTFGSLVCGTAIMLLPSDDDLPPPPGGRRDRKLARLAPLRIPVRRDERR